MKTVSFAEKLMEKQESDKRVVEVSEHILARYREWRQSDEAKELMNDAINEMMTAFFNGGGSADKYDEQLSNFFAVGFFAGMDYQLETLRKQAEADGYLDRRTRHGNE